MGIAGARSPSARRGRSWHEGRRRGDDAGPAAAGILGLQRTIGNRAVTELIQRAPKAKADPTVAVQIRRPTGIPFALPPSVVAGRSVAVSGRIGVSGRLSVPGGTLPKAKEAAAHLRSEAETALTALDTKVGPTGVSADVGGQSVQATVKPEGAATAALSHLRLSAVELAFAQTRVKGAADIDLLVEIGPGKGSSKSESDPAALGSASFGTAEAVLEDRYVEDPKTKKLKLAAARNTAAVPAEHLDYAEKAAAVLSSKFDEMIADTGLKGKKHGKTDPGKDLREELGTKYDVIRWLSFMRPWFGSDDKTLAHFSQMRQVQGQSNLLLHDSAATRLEAVQSKLGEGGFPMSTVGWSFRGEMQLGESQAHKHMHKIGCAVDFDAYNLPHQTNAKMRYLIKLVTGREHRLAPKSGSRDWSEYSTRRALIRDIEKGTEPGSARDKEKAAFLDALGAEVDALAAASDRFKVSLGEGGAEKLNALRAEWRAAQQQEAEARKGKDKTKDKEAIANAEAATAAKKAEITAALTTLLKPWLAKIDAERAALEAKAKDRHGVDLNAAAADPGEAKALSKEAKAVAAVAAKLKKGKALSKKEQAALAALGQKVLPSMPDEITAETADAIAAAAALKVSAINEAVAREKPASGLRAAHQMAGELRSSLLSDFEFLFGSTSSGKEDMAVAGPSATQLVNRGYFRVAPEDASPDVKRRMISRAFVLEMVQQGFEIGGGWESADAMHFEIAFGKSPAALDAAGG